MSQEFVEVHAVMIDADCMATPKITVSLRITEAQHKAWTASAQADARSLASWVQRCCDQVAGVKPGPPPPRAKRARKA